MRSIERNGHSEGRMAMRREKRKDISEKREKRELVTLQ
jgi:hypothetical protein